MDYFIGGTAYILYLQTKSLDQKTDNAIMVYDLWHRRLCHTQHQHIKETIADVMGLEGLAGKVIKQSYMSIPHDARYRLYRIACCIASRHVLHSQ